MDETGEPIGNADGNNPQRKRGWLWVLAPLRWLFHLVLSRSAELAKQVLGEPSLRSWSRIAMAPTADFPSIATRFAGRTSSVN